MCTSNHPEKDLMTREPAQPIVHIMDSTDWRSRLRTKIAESGRSMQDLSLAAGRSRNYVRSILSEGKEPGLEAFTEICDALNVNPLWVLYGGEEDFAASVELFREFARLTDEQRAGFFALARSMRPKE